MEDLYLPYRPKRKTRAGTAREKGLLPLSDKIWDQSLTQPALAEAEQFISEEKGVADAKEP